MSRQKNIGVVGLDDFHHRLLETVRDAENYRFHGIIPYTKVVNPERYAIEELVHDARRRMSEIEGGLDAIIGHWDFPTTSLVPFLAADAGLLGPLLESVLLCENKYGTRFMEQEAVPDLIPPFALVNPGEDAVADDPPLPYPFWLKPVVAFSSALGFRIDCRADLDYALKRINDGIGKFAEPFERLMQHARFADKRALLAGGYCVAEGMLSGRGCTVEGYVLNGEPRIYGVIDSLRGSNEVSFVGYHYPSELPDRVHQRMLEASCRVIRHIGLDRSTFNIEFFWEKHSDALHLLEINPRISKSHSPIFRLVEGASQHEVAIDVALGREPQFPRGEGSYRHAAKFMPRTYQSARVTRVPSEEDVSRLRERFPKAEFTSPLREGTELANLPNQDSYSFELGSLFLGGESREELTENFHEAMKVLGFRFSRRVETNYD